MDPLGKAWGVPAAKQRKHSLWLDLRTSEITFAQMVVVKLFYAVRQIVDEAGTSLPKGAGVQGLLFDEMRYDRDDTMGQNLPIFVQGAAGLVNATLKDTTELVSSELRAPTTVDELKLAEAELAESGGAIALPSDPMLWAVALTGLKPDKLQCLEGNEGA